MTTEDQQTTGSQTFEKLFDYAGLFPPAGLSMQDTVVNFCDYLQQTHAWMLNCMVVPASRLNEFAQVASELHRDQPIALSVLSSDWLLDHELIEQFRANHAGLASVISIESRQIEFAAAIKSTVPRVYVEIPIAERLALNLTTLEEAGVHAKIRTGGLTADAFPPNDHLATFLMECCRQDIEFKATAGLHHPLARVRPASSSSDAPDVSMHGFVNLMVALEMAEQGGTADDVTSAIAMPEDEAKTQWGAPEFWARLKGVRSRFHSIGSCSFTEPLEDLQTLGWL